jgi:hypothetical protein
MRSGKIRAILPRLEGLRRRFERWRRARKIGSRIPEALWAAAVKSAEAYGVHPTAQTLGLDYYSLKKRLEEKPSARSTMAATANVAKFVELTTTPPTGISECILELEDVAGAKLRIHLKGIEAPDVAALSRSLWGVE